MEPHEVLNLLEELMGKHGLLELGWSYGLDNQKRQYGVCCDERRYIGISKPLSKLNPYPQTRQTILHEIAHALVGCQHGHDEVWAQRCVEIGGDGKEFYGCQVRTPNTGVIQLPYQPG